MMLFDFFKKKPAAKKLLPVKNYARYKIVSGTDEWQREMGVPEFKTEDEILN